MGNSVAPRQFSSPSMIGSSGSANLVQQAQAVPQIAQQDFIPLNPAPTQAAPAIPAQSQAVDQNSIDPNEDPISTAMRQANQGYSYSRGRQMMNSY